MNACSAAQSSEIIAANGDPGVAASKPKIEKRHYYGHGIMSNYGHSLFINTKIQVGAAFQSCLTKGIEEHHVKIGKHVYCVENVSGSKMIDFQMWMDRVTYNQTSKHSCGSSELGLLIPFVIFDPKDTFVAKKIRCQISFLDSELKREIVCNANKYIDTIRSGLKNVILTVRRKFCVTIGYDQFVISIIDVEGELSGADRCFTLDPETLIEIEAKDRSTIFFSRGFVKSSEFDGAIKFFLKKIESDGALIVLNKEDLEESIKGSTWIRGKPNQFSIEGEKVGITFSEVLSSEGAKLFEDTTDSYSNCLVIDSDESLKQERYIFECDHSIALIDLSKETRAAENMSFKIISFTPSQSMSENAVKIDVQELQRKIRNLDKVWVQKEQIEIRLLKGLCKLRLSSTYSEIEEGKYKTAWEVDEKTNITFVLNKKSMPESNNLYLIDSEERCTTLERVMFRIVSFTPRKLNKSFVQIDIQELQKKIRDLDKNWGEKEQVEIPLLKGNCVLKLSDTFSGIQEKRYETLWRLNEETRIELELKKSLLGSKINYCLIDSEKPPEVAAKMVFEMVFFNMEDRDDVQVEFIDVEAIEKEIRSLRKFFVVRESFKIVTEKMSYQLSVFGPDNEQKCKKRLAIGEETDLFFIKRSKLEAPLVEVSKSVIPKVIEFEVKAVDLSGEIVTQNNLEACIRECAPEYMTLKTTFNGNIIVNNILIDLRFSIKQFKYDADLKYEALVQLSDETELKFYPDASKSVLIEKEQVFKGRPTPQHCIELGIGGLYQEILEVYTKLIFSRTPQGRDSMIRRGIKPEKGLLFYGPPGTGKTSLARKFAHLLGCNESRVSHYVGSEFFNKYIGETESNIRAMFEPAVKAYRKYGDKSPLFIIIIDEIEALAATRKHTSESCHKDGFVDQLIGSIDGIEEVHNFVIIGLTNRKEAIDPAVLRPGRLGFHIEIGLPKTSSARKEILMVHTSKLRAGDMLDDDVDLDELAELTVGFSGAELEALVRAANSTSMSRSLLDDSNENKLQRNDFLEAYNSWKRSTIRK